MKVYLDWDERWPDPSVNTKRLGNFERELEVSKTEWADWVRVLKEYNDWCEKWRKIVDEAQTANE